MSFTKNNFKRYSLLIILSIILSSCNYAELMGIKEHRVDPPPGEYLGTAKLLDKTEAEKPASDFKVKITLLPRKEGFTDGVGILSLNNSADKFYWRDDGNNEDTWNLLFTKDNNLYSSIKNTFRFNGLVIKRLTENYIEGHLYKDYDTRIEEYYIEAYQIHEPKLIAGKEALVVKASESFELSADKVGDDISKLSLSLISSDEKAEEKILPISSISEVKGVTMLKVNTSKDLAKGEYSLFVTRDEKHPSNRLTITVE